MNTVYGRRQTNNEFHPLTIPDTPPRTGMVFVFDMDDTISHTDEDIFTREYNRNGAYLEQIHINPQILDVLREAEARKASGQVAAIFLYTNNSSNLYINLVHYKLRHLLQGVTPTSLTSVSKVDFEFDPVFDDIVSRNDIRRTNHTNSPYKKKTFADIEMMCRGANVSTEYLPQRTFFFDDQIHPDLLEKLPKGHYIHIGRFIPSLNTINEERFMAGFTPNAPSTTNLGAVRKALGVGGGRRRSAKKHRHKKHKRYSIRVKK